MSKCDNPDCTQYHGKPVLYLHQKEITESIDDVKSSGFSVFHWAETRKITMCTTCARAVELFTFHMQQQYAEKKKQGGK